MASLNIKEVIARALSATKNYVDKVLQNKADKNHTHSYAGSSSDGGAANSVKTDLIVKLNGGTTENTNQFTYNGSTAKTVNITASSIGAAGTNHGTHLTIGTGASNAAAGNHTHNYAGSSSAGGTANSVNGYTLWVGTQAQYDAITSKSNTTIYYIK